MTKKKSKQPAKKDAAKPAVGKPAVGKPAVGKPRFDPVQRLLYRFYEPLLLLHTLNPTIGEHSSPQIDTNIDTLTIRQLRRRFLDDLAYFCDYDKGGDTVTAIAIESRPQGLIFWLASNTKPGSKVVDFLKGILNDLRQFPNSQNKDRKEMETILAQKAIDFGHRRIRKYRSLLRRLLSRASKVLALQNSHEDRALALWLCKFRSKKEKPYELCQLSYQDRRSPCMKRLAALSQDTAQISSSDSARALFRDIRHYVGRLGYHFRAAQTLVEVAEVVPHYFDDYEVRPCRPPDSPFSVPTPDALMTFPRIVGRMFRDAGEKTRDCQERLAFLDSRFKLSEQFLKAWTDETFQPKIHCELVLLEHFYANQLAFLESDRYIGCSKPACYCCALYIRHHPGRFVEPASHQKAWLNWRPPDASYLPDGKGAESHRNILNNVISHIRGDVINQISERTPHHSWHPDSVTGLSTELYGSAVNRCSSEPSSTSDIEIHSDSDSDSDPGGGTMLPRYEQLSIAA